MKFTKNLKPLALATILTTNISITGCQNHHNKTIAPPQTLCLDEETLKFLEFKHLFTAAWRGDEDSPEFLYAALGLAFGSYEAGFDVVGILDMRKIHEPIPEHLFRHFAASGNKAIEVFYTSSANEKINTDSFYRLMTRSYFPGNLVPVIAEKDSELEKNIRERERWFYLLPHTNGTREQEEIKKYKFTPPSLEPMTDP